MSTTTPEITPVRRELVEGEIRWLVQDRLGHDAIEFRRAGCGRCEHSTLYAKVYVCPVTVPLGHKITYHVTYCPTCRVAWWIGAAKEKNKVIAVAMLQHNKTGKVCDVRTIRDG